MTVSAWTKKLKTEDEKSQYLKSLDRAKWVLDDIKTIISENLSSVESAEISPKSYDNVNWPYRQAHANGYKQATRDFMKLLTLDQKD